MRAFKLLNKLVFGLTLFFSFLSQAQNTPVGYNEIFDANQKVRPIYQEIYDLWQQRYSKYKDQKAFLKQSRKSFSGDNTMDSMPRLIESSEYDRLKLGVEQRAKAIRAFLEDHYYGVKYYAQVGLIPEKVVDRIIARSGEAGYTGLVDPAHLSFFYGPDIIRDAQGQWRVIEDNPGFIGGIGDLTLAQDVALKAYPELNDYFPRKASDFYKNLAESYKERAKKIGGIAIE